MSDQDLASRKCQSSGPQATRIDDSHVGDLRAQIDPAWDVEGTALLRRAFSFPNFRDAFGFATRVALVAESEGHHPDMTVGWGRVEVATTTHSAGGLTENDFILAAKVDRLAR
jgi:4a-hydroxytetrahydrobiopterin dehydratase